VLRRPGVLGLAAAAAAVAVASAAAAGVPGTGAKVAVGLGLLAAAGGAAVLAAGWLSVLLPRDGDGGAGPGETAASVRERRDRRKENGS
jgi:hypothetical protein